VCSSGLREESEAQLEPAATLAFPSAVMALLEMRNPSPLASVHLTPAVDEAQVKGPRVIDWP
jgi:hypothetical protein